MPLLETWASGTLLWRCHGAGLRADQFNPGVGLGRFHPISDATTGGQVPTLYGADSVSGALSESVFHNVPVRGSSKRVRRSALSEFRLSSLVARRDLVLASLSGNGLTRLGLRRRALIDSPASHYLRTSQWAEAIHRDTMVDGLLWVSRQNDRALAVVLFGDRVGPPDFDVVVDSSPLDRGAGWDSVLRCAEDAGIMIVLSR